MPIDNRVYDQLADRWWDPDEPAPTLLRKAVNPARFGYFREILVDRLQWNPVDLRALDVGCGGGLLAEEVARLGCRVTGIDPSAPSIVAARTHARRAGLSIRYGIATGEAMPFPAGAFDAAYCCDVLEHVRDIDAVLAETARVLRPGGLFFYDTINRTLWSYVVVIKVLQEWSWSRLLPRDLHDWRLFVTPQELTASMARSGLEHRETRGMSPRQGLIRVVRAIRQFKRGAMRAEELARRLELTTSRNIMASYMGYAVRP